MELFDTIAAVSTPRGKGGVAMIRISGADAISISERVFFPRSGRPLSAYSPRTAVYGEIRAADENGESCSIDDGIAVVYRAPNSFTGEDTVEICCHGGVLITQNVLAACLAAGCRPATAGEFTRRAFVAGKMSLSQAESLGNLLEAKTDAQLKLSRGGMSGRLGSEIASIYSSLKTLLASVYARIDFPDEDLASMTEEEIAAELSALIKRLKKLAGTYKAGHAVSEGVRTVICGAANAGKSSLYNLIVGREAAIVTDIEGTTRDILETTAAMGRVTLLLCDTAGIRDTDDRVERIGIDRTKDAISSAELIIAVFDGLRDVDEEDRELVELISASPAAKLAVINKLDGGECSPELEAFAKANFENTVSISALTGEGFPELVAVVEELFECGEADLLSDAIIWDARRYAAVVRSVSLLEGSLEAVSAGLPLDLSSSDAEAAMALLGELDGRGVSEDIVSEIFSHFCVGK